MKDCKDNKASGQLGEFRSPLGVWALSFGCAVGWGAFVMPGNTFLPISGPWGTIIGLVIGTALMYIIGMNYQYMMLHYPTAGGTFTYTKKVLGYDAGFLSAWFLILTYIAIVWANMTALSLISRTVFGDVLQFGFHYSLAGFDIYFGEILLELVVLFVCGLLCSKQKLFANFLQTVAAILLIVGIIIIVALVLRGHDLKAEMQPAFTPHNGAVLSVINIVALAPWAFIGFESISHSAKSFRFPVEKTKWVFLGSLIAGFIAYGGLTLVAVVSRPDGLSDWHTYIHYLSDYTGYASRPVFLGVYQTLGERGVLFLAGLVLAGILTGIIGNTIAASRLMYAMARDDILPECFGEVSQQGVPEKATFFIMGISAIVPFFGRTAIGWIVDVTTIGAAIAYGFTSAAAYKKSKEKDDHRTRLTGMIGIIAAAFFGLYLMVPSLWSISAIAAESYLILAVWSILGFVFFRYVFKKDKKRRFGKSTVVWIALLFLIFFSSAMWSRQNTNNEVEGVIADLDQKYMEEIQSHGGDMDEAELQRDQAYLREQMEGVTDSLMHNSVLQMVLVFFALFILFDVYSQMQAREKKLEAERFRAEENSRAKSTFLSNMSHDIRTPMNAIIGYINLAKREDIALDELKEYMDKIEGSSQHLLALINDVLEMSRIESGKMELEEISTDLCEVMDAVRDMFETQMQAKSVGYTVESDIRDPYVLCDKNRLNRVLLNLISNAYKFTPQGGNVSVRLTQENTREDDEKHTYVLAVKDTGIGMTEEFAAKVFEAFERERTSTVSGIQGTGLGMAITKSIVDMMGGDITVNTAPNEGTEFVLHLSFLPYKKRADEHAKKANVTTEEMDFSHIRILLVEDMDVNREIATMLLARQGFMVESAVNGKEAVDKIKASENGYFDVVLMDIQMPVMNGYEATRAIRALSDTYQATIPIIAMTANAFSEDIREALDAGMNGHIAKPIDVKVMMDTLKEVLLQ